MIKAFIKACIRKLFGSKIEIGQRYYLKSKTEKRDVPQFRCVVTTSSAYLRVQSNNYRMKTWRNNRTERRVRPGARLKRFDSLAISLLKS